MTKLINISQLSKELNLIDKKNNKPTNHILRYWEKEFKQIKPKLVNNRRYYTKETVELIKLIKFLLKDKGLTIKGVKNVLKSDINELDDYNSDSLKASYYKHNFKLKSLKILNKLKNLKIWQKNTY